MMKVLCMKSERSSIQRLYVYTGWQSLSQRRRFHRLRWFYKILNNLAPSYLADLIPPTTGERRHAYTLRNRENITLLGLTDNSMPNHCFPPLCETGTSCQSMFKPLQHYLFSMNTLHATSKIL